MLLRFDDLLINSAAIATVFSDQTAGNYMIKLTSGYSYTVKINPTNAAELDRWQRYEERKEHDQELLIINQWYVRAQQIAYVQVTPNTWEIVMVGGLKQHLYFADKVKDEFARQQAWTFERWLRHHQQLLARTPPEA